MVMHLRNEQLGIVAGHSFAPFALPSSTHTCPAWTNASMKCELLTINDRTANDYKKKGRPQPPLRQLGFLLRLARLLLAETGLHARADTGQHVFRGLRELAVRLEFEILVERVSSALGGHHLIALQGRLADHV